MAQDQKLEAHCHLNRFERLVLELQHCPVCDALRVRLPRKDWEVGKERFYRVYTEEVWARADAALREPCPH